MRFTGKLIACACLLLLTHSHVFAQSAEIDRLVEQIRSLDQEIDAAREPIRDLQQEINAITNARSSVNDLLTRVQGGIDDARRKRNAAAANRRRIDNHLSKLQSSIFEQAQLIRQFEEAKDNETAIRIGRRLFLAVNGRNTIPPRRLSTLSDFVLQHRLRLRGHAAALVGSALGTLGKLVVDSFSQLKDLPRNAKDLTEQVVDILEERSTR